MIPMDLIHNLFKRVGLDVRRYRDPLRFLTEYQIKTVLDIGANSGQFADAVRRVLPDARIHSFEPLPKPHARLLRRMRRDRSFAAHRLAVGSTNGQVLIYENEFSPSSSLLSLAPLHRESFPFATRTEARDVPIVTLDRWAEDWSLDGPLLIKIDVQGYEDHVITGGARVLGRAAVLIVEVSFCRLYEGQPLFEGIHELLDRANFQFVGTLDRLVQAKTGIVLQCDALFVSRNPGQKSAEVR